MSVQFELQSAALAMHEQHDDALADLLDQIALTTPPSVIESQASPIVRKALAVARAYRSPGASLAASDVCVCLPMHPRSDRCTAHGAKAVAR